MARRRRDVGENRLLDAHEVAELLNVKVSWVREHTTNGDIPHLQLGRYRRYRRNELFAWLDRQSAGGKAS
jgi:excisionase family DNA binding protein